MGEEDLPSSTFDLTPRPRGRSFLNHDVVQRPNQKLDAAGVPARTLSATSSELLVMQPATCSCSAAEGDGASGAEIALIVLPSCAAASSTDVLSRSGGRRGGRRELRRKGSFCHGCGSDCARSCNCGRPGIWAVLEKEHRQWTKDLDFTNCMLHLSDYVTGRVFHRAEKKNTGQSVGCIVTGGFIMTLGGLLVPTSGPGGAAVMAAGGGLFTKGLADQGAATTQPILPQEDYYLLDGTSGGEAAPAGEDERGNEVGDATTQRLALYRAVPLGTDGLEMVRHWLAQWLLSKGPSADRLVGENSFADLEENVEFLQKDGGTKIGLFVNGLCDRLRRRLHATAELGAIVLSSGDRGMAFGGDGGPPGGREFFTRRLAEEARVQLGRILSSTVYSGRGGATGATLPSADEGEESTILETTRAGLKKLESGADLTAAQQARETLFGPALAGAAIGAVSSLPLELLAIAIYKHPVYGPAVVRAMRLAWQYGYDVGRFWTSDEEEKK